jgi:hypothetical protein
MSIHKKITNPDIYFITFTNHAWIPLLQLSNGYDIVYNWFRILKEKEHFVTGYVIMPNHLHLLLYYSAIRQSLNTIIGNGKLFMAYEIVTRLKETKLDKLLVKLQNGVKPKDKARGKIHEIWTDSFDVKECRTEKLVLQKLNYIHNNPCAGKWRLAPDPVHYPHSSASFYISGQVGIYPVSHYRDFLKCYG